MADWYCDRVLTGELEIERVYESEAVLAFRHTMPFFEVHVVVIPKVHVPSLAELTDPSLALELIQVCARICKDIAEAHGGCRVCTNVGDHQSAEHLHFYVHAGRRLRDEDGRLLPPPE